MFAATSPVKKSVSGKMFYKKSSFCKYCVLHYIHGHYQKITQTYLTQLNKHKIMMIKYPSQCTYVQRHITLQPVNQEFRQ